MATVQKMPRALRIIAAPASSRRHCGHRRMNGLGSRGWCTVQHQQALVGFCSSAELTEDLPPPRGPHVAGVISRLLFAQSLVCCPTYAPRPRRGAPASLSAGSGAFPELAQVADSFSLLAQGYAGWAMMVLRRRYRRPAPAVRCHRAAVKLLLLPSAAA